jgi:hypothetical protein
MPNEFIKKCNSFDQNFVTGPSERGLIYKAVASVKRVCSNVSIDAFPQALRPSSFSNLPFIITH